MDGNDSQITLIDPQPPLELVLEKPLTPLNTRLLVGGRPRFKISTLGRDADTTDVTDLRTKQVISSLRRRAVFPDKVKFANRFGGHSVKKESWMSEFKFPSGHTGWLIENESGRFVWRWDAALRMVLTPENAPDEILAFAKDEPVFALVVQRSAESYLDQIILAFALLEQRLRLGVKELKIAEGKALQDRFVVGRHVDAGLQMPGRTLPDHENM